MGEDCQCYRFLLLGLQFQVSLITCVQLNIAMIITVHLNYAKWQLDILKLPVHRTDELDVVNKFNEQNSAWWDN